MDGEWWYVGAFDGYRRRLTAYNRKNDTRMFVNGKYVPKAHPLHKPGNFKSWEKVHDHQKLNSVKEGSIYIITNPAWPGWVKVGMAVDAEDRCKSFNTGSPYRDYDLQYSHRAEDKRAAEKQAHDILEKHSGERRGEWFKIMPLAAIHLLKTIHRSN